MITIFCNNQITYNILQLSDSPMMIIFVLIFVSTFFIARCCLMFFLNSPSDDCMFILLSPWLHFCFACGWHLHFKCNFSHLQHCQWSRKRVREVCVVFWRPFYLLQAPKVQSVSSSAPSWRKFALCEPWSILTNLWLLPCKSAMLLRGIPLSLSILLISLLASWRDPF